MILIFACNIASFVQNSTVSTQKPVNKTILFHRSYSTVSTKNLVNKTIEEALNLCVFRVESKSCNRNCVLIINLFGLIEYLKNKNEFYFPRKRRNSGWGQFEFE